MGSMSRKTFDAFRKDLAGVIDRYLGMASLEGRLLEKKTLGSCVLIAGQVWVEAGDATAELENVFGGVTELKS